MVESIQKTSSLPVPDFHTQKGAKDPLPLNAPNEARRRDDTVRDAAARDRQDGFEAYLNETSITTLEKAQRGASFDTAAEIAAASVYKPGGKSPI